MMTVMSIITLFSLNYEKNSAIYKLRFVGLSVWLFDLPRIETYVMRRKSFRHLVQFFCLW